MSKDLVVKDNKLIEAKYNLTTLEQKVLIKAISMINKEDSDLKMYKFSVTEFANMLDLHSKKNIYTQLKELCKGLVNNKNFAIDTENGGFLYFNWVASAEYKPSEAVIEIEFSQKLKPMLLELKERFTTYYIANVMSLKSSYAIRLFEILKQYEAIGTRLVTVEDLKQMLGLLNVEKTEEKYNLYGHFKSRVLLPAQKEIKQKTDIYFTFEEVKENKRVVAIKFYIHENKKNKKQVELQEYSQMSMDTFELQRLFKEETGVEIPTETMNSLIQDYSAERVKKYIDNWDKFKHQNLKNVLGFFISAVSQGYEIPTRTRGHRGAAAHSKEYEGRDWNSYYDNL